MRNASENSWTERQEAIGDLDLRKIRSRFKELIGESLKIITEAQRVNGLTLEESHAWNIKLTAAIANLQINGFLK